MHVILDLMSNLFDSISFLIGKTSRYGDPDLQSILGLQQFVFPGLYFIILTSFSLRVAAIVVTVILDVVFNETGDRGDLLLGLNCFGNFHHYFTLTVFTKNRSCVCMMHLFCLSSSLPSNCPMMVLYTCVVFCIRLSKLLLSRNYYCYFFSNSLIIILFSCLFFRKISCSFYAFKIQFLFLNSFKA